MLDVDDEGGQGTYGSPLYFLLRFAVNLKEL